MNCILASQTAIADLLAEAMIALTTNRSVRFLRQLILVLLLAFPVMLVAATPHKTVPGTRSPCSSVDVDSSKPWNDTKIDPHAGERGCVLTLSAASGITAAKSSARTASATDSPWFEITLCPMPDTALSLPAKAQARVCSRCWLASAWNSKFWWPGDSILASTRARRMPETRAQFSCQDRKIGCGSCPSRAPRKNGGNPDSCYFPQAF
jgi:hypothetical protein